MAIYYYAYACKIIAAHISEKYAAVQSALNSSVLLAATIVALIYPFSNANVIDDYSS